MTKQILITLMCGMFFVAAAENHTDVPKGATEVSPNVYRVVDKDGKAWIYRRTPFGMQKRLEDADKTDQRDTSATPFGISKPSDAAAASALQSVKSNSEHSNVTPFGETKSRTAVQTKATEDGDSIRFERPTPFGVTRWTRRKSELSSEEKKIWETQRTGSGTADAK